MKLIVALSVVVMASCGRSDAPGPTALDNAPARSLREQGGARVVFGSGIHERVVRVEIAQTRDDITRGLMFRKSMPEDAGMLFLMPDEEVQSFWMKNTYIPLDMIFIRGNMSIAGIIHHAEPRTLASRTIGRPSRFVLEVNGGWAERNGVTEETAVRFVKVPEP